MEIIPAEGYRCPVCGSEAIESFFEARQVPVHCGVLWPDHDGAIHAPRGDINLGFCHGCSHVFNLSFNPGLMHYSQPYDNSLHFSPHFQSYARSLAERLIEQYGLHGKDIIEIGSGKGDFLRLICNLGDNRGTGFDPSYVPNQEEERLSEAVSFIQDYYSEQYADYPADLICSRQTLEHMHNPREFITMLRRMIGMQVGTTLFFEVPNFLYPRPENAVWDVIYEHYSYFNRYSLACLFSQCGFDVLEIGETFDRLFLSIDVKPGINAIGRMPDEDLAKIDKYFREVKALIDKHREKVADWVRKIEEIGVTGRKVVAWGAGARGLSFLNLLHIQDEIPYIVDINPRKWGMFIAGTCQEIISPDFLQEYQPDTVIIINPVYKHEIATSVHALGLDVEFLFA